MTVELRPARVRVPCSASNLGSGFDTLGLALDRYLEIGFDPGGDELRTALTGTLEPLAAEGDDLVSTTFREVLNDAGARPTGRLHAYSDIPIARGLGSSAAAVVGAFDLARSALGLEPHPHAAFARAATSDGHPDNAAPCVWGGLRGVAPGIDGLPRSIELPLSDEVGFAFAAPAAGLATAAAREALPKHVLHEVAAASLGRITALLRGLGTGDPELIRIGIEDDLHVPFRISLIPNAHNAIFAAGEAGAWATTISGSGSGLISFCAPDDTQAVADAMWDALCLGTEDPACPRFAAQADRAGVIRMETEARQVDPAAATRSA